MQKLIGVWFILIVFAPEAQAASEETTASRVFAAASPSIVVVRALDSSGQVIALGSGVVIAKEIVVSNCHVFTEEDTATASIFYRDKYYPATLRYADPEHDLCSFTVKNLTAPSVPMRNADNLKIGENAYAIGAPKGLNLTLSSGLISGLRQMPDGTVIQTTAPISHGSSGGGLFDSEGRLIGITSFYINESQQLNFALPVEWIKALPQRGKTPQELVSRESKTKSDFQHGIRAYLSGDYKTAVSIFKSLAKLGDASAQAILGGMYSSGEGVVRDQSIAVYWYHKAAMQGVAYAQGNLGVMYANGEGVPQDYAKAAYWFNKAAINGNINAQNNLGLAYYEGQGLPKNYTKAVYWFNRAAMEDYAAAQNNLGAMYANGHGVPRDYAKAIYWYHEAAKQGDALAQYNLGLAYQIGEGAPQDYAKALYWLREAAIQGHANAQAALGAAYAIGQGAPRDDVKAAKWAILAKAGGNEVAKELLSLVESTMTPEQIAEAQRLANEWWDAHHEQ